MSLEQWFSTFGSWRPIKQNKTQLGDPFSSKSLLKYIFGDPKVGRDPPDEKHCSRAFCFCIIIINLKENK